MILFMTIILGISLRINEAKLTKEDKSGLLSQQNLILAHETLSRGTFNWVVAYYRKYIELRNEKINIPLLNECNGEEIRLEAFNKAAKWVTKRKSSGALLDENSQLPYKSQPSSAVTNKAKNDRDKRNLAVNNIVVTISEAVKYHAFQKEAYANFNAEFGTPKELFGNITLETVLSQINNSCDDTSLYFNGEVLWDQYKDKLEPLRKRKTLPAWAIEFLIEQEGIHPASKFKNGQLWVPLYLAGQETPVYYPASRRVTVQEIKNAATAVNKHASRFFAGGNLNQGVPRFRKFKDDQTFELQNTTVDKMFEYEKPNFLKQLPLYTSEYVSREKKAPTKKIQDQWKKEYITKWYAANPTPRLSSVSSIVLPKIGKVRVDSHGVKRFHELMYPDLRPQKGGNGTTTSKHIGGTRISRKGGELSVSFSIQMPEGWVKPRPVSYSVGGQVGVDVGVIESAVLSTKYSFSNISRNSRHEANVSSIPRNSQEKAFKKSMAHEDKGYERLRLLQEKLEVLQRSASEIYDRILKENNGSHAGVWEALPKRWHTLQQQIKQTYNQITNIRSHHRHVIAKAITSNFDLVGIENLNVKGMISKNYTKTDDLGAYLPNGQSAKQGMNKALSAVGLGELLLLIRQKAAFYGTEVQIVDRWFASSLICSNCGKKKDKAELSLTHREYNCSYCNITLGRDHNAALNILEAAKVLSKGGKVKESDIVSFEDEVKSIEKAIRAQKTPKDE